VHLLVLINKNNILV